MVQINIGCAGWDYKDWIGPFYPRSLEKYRYLEYYSKYFDIVEINSTFYNIPSEMAVNKWLIQTPDEFRFIVKVWQEITHKKIDNDIISKISQFFSRLEPLNEKIIAYLVQFPPWFKYSDKHLKQLHLLKNELPSDLTYMIELRDDSWIRSDSLSKIIDGKNFALVTSYLEGINPYYLPNQQKYYIRLIGDRKLTIFNRVQRTNVDTLEDLDLNMHKLINSPEVYQIFIIVNNHYSGFAPETANILKMKFDVPVKHFSTQKKLSDFF